MMPSAGRARRIDLIAFPSVTLTLVADMISPDPSRSSPFEIRNTSRKKVNICFIHRENVYNEVRDTYYGVLNT